MFDWTWRRKLTVIILVFIVTTAISASISRAIPVVGTCDGDSLIQKIDFDVEGDEYNITLKTIECPYGCVDNATQYGSDCALPEIERNEPSLLIVSIIVFGILMIIFTYLSIKVGEEHWPMQMLFLALSLIFGATLLNISRIIMENIGQTTIAGYMETIYGGYVIIAIFIGFYYAIKFFQFIVEKINYKKAEKKRKREEDD